MKRLLIWLIVLGAIMFLASNVYGSDYQRCVEATCRIKAGSSSGTGCVFAHYQGGVYVLTNAHVVGSAQNVTCEFWQQGHVSKPLTARVTSVTTEADAAVLVLSESVFGGRVPPAIPLMSSKRRLLPGETVFSVGCAGGAWATSFTGHVKSDDGESLNFVPSPANGRSGSAIFSADGRFIVGLLRARNDQAGHGIACTVGRLVRFLRIGVRRVAQGAIGGCGPEGCPTDRFLMPYRRQQQPPQNPYPTLPVPQQVYPTLPLPAPSLQVDLSGVKGKLDKLLTLQQQLVEELRAANPPPSTRPKPPIEVKPLEVLGVPAEKIAETVGDAVSAGMDEEGGLGSKLRAGAADLLRREAEDGEVSNALIKGGAMALLGPWGIIAAMGIIWVKNRYFPSLARALDPMKPDTPAMTRQKEGLKKVLNGDTPTTSENSPTINGYAPGNTPAPKKE